MNTYQDNLRHTGGLLLATVLWLAATAPAFADFDRGMRAYNNYDYDLAREEFLKSALQGHTEAQFYLAEILEGGVGTAIDYPGAVKWYTKAAEKEHKFAQARLASLYHRGLGDIKQDHTKAFKWYLRAAENGHYIAQYHLGLIYAKGQGTKKDPVKACKWLGIATSYGDSDAPGELDALQKTLPKKQVDRASRLAAEWEKRREAKLGNNP